MNLRLIGPDEISDPEVLAMLQAFYSRSPMPIDDRLADLMENDKDGDKTSEEKIKSAMKRYYVDYGHASIGEMGGCTIFIEDVSMLAAKAIQDSELYVGQECSTRYIDFSQQRFHNPCPGEFNSDEVLDDYRAFYLQALPQVMLNVASIYDPAKVLSRKIPADKVEASFKATCKAIAFDICRGLLPAGATTSLAWTGNFRVMNDHLRYLAYHPLTEVRMLARKIYSQLSVKFRSSFKDELLNPNDRVGDMRVYYNTDDYTGSPQIVNYLQTQVPRYTNTFYKYRSPRDHAAYFEIKGGLDFGSYRDLQRHRHGMNRMPMLNMANELEPFYTSALDRALGGHQQLTDTMLKVATGGILTHMSPEEAQYFMPMALKVPTHLFWSIGQLEYVLKLRTTTSVHPTLRKYMQKLHSKLRQEDRERIIINTQEDYESSDRGEQTIKEKA